VDIEPYDDGHALPEIGAWSKRKYHYLGRYLDAFTTAMREKWGQIHYVDPFAGAGWARIKTTGEIVATSAWLAAEVRFPFTMLHLCDAKKVNVEALRARLGRLTLPYTPRIIHADANDAIDDLVKPIPARGALCVTFADPFGLHLDFETVKRIAAIRSDLLILLADNMDALRNWAEYYRENPDSNLDRFIGEPGWRDLFEKTPSDKRAEALRDRYKEKLTSLGYTWFAHERVQNTSGRDIYILLYASRDKAGIKIWNGVSQIDEGGQRKLW
jgi:three-Cys-motif partner protein